MTERRILTLPRICKLLFPGLFGGFCSTDEMQVIVSSKMWKFPGVISVFNFIILLTLVALSGGGPLTFKYVMEGDSIKLNFSFPCSSSKVTLRQGHKAPFYDSTNPESMPLSDRYEINEKEGHNCSLQLEINPVHRSDEGGYILTAYDGQGNYLEDSRIGLTVHHPPGVASCEWLEENLVDDWGSMLCKAPAGSTRGIIACYQNEQRLPPKTTLVEASDVLQQTISVRYSQFAFCCAALQGKLIDMCECTDFVWCPSHSGNITGPCAEPAQDSIPPHSLEGDYAANSSATTTFIPKPQTITERPAWQDVYNSPYGGLLVVVGTLVFIIIILCVFLTAAFRKIRQIGLIRQNGPYATGSVVEAQL